MRLSSRARALLASFFIALALGARHERRRDDTHGNGVTRENGKAHAPHFPGRRDAALPSFRQLRAKAGAES